MNKASNIETHKKSKYWIKKRIGKKLWVCFVCGVLLLGTPFITAQAPELAKEKSPGVVFTKNFLEWSTHAITFSYSPLEEVWRSIRIEIPDPFRIENVQTNTHYYSFLKGEIHSVVSLVDPARNTIQCELWYRVLDNTDVLLFLEYSNSYDRAFPIHYRVHYQDENMEKIPQEEKPDVRVFRYSGKDYWEESTHLQVLPTQNGDSFGEAIYGTFYENRIPSSSFYKGCLFPYRESDFGIITHIDNIEATTYTDRSPDGSCTISNHTLLEDHSALRDWYVFSAESLMNIDSAVTRKVMLISDFGLKKYYFEDGFYYSTYLSGYENESPQGFYWDYSMYAPRSFLEYYYKEEERFLYAICVNSFLALANHRNPEGYWMNGTVSKWLKSEYAMEDHYFDTRFCTDAALFLLRFYQEFDVELAREVASKVGDLLVDGIRKGFTYDTPNYGFMLQDYFLFEQPQIRVHASLNHLLNEASFLLLLGDVTNVETYTNAAMRIINSINATCEEWKNTTNHDLYYARLPSGKFGLQDYVTLTYHDLIRFRSMVHKYLPEEPFFVQNLGKWKEDFLLEKKIVHSPKFTGQPEDLSPLLDQDEKK